MEGLFVVFLPLIAYVSTVPFMMLGVGVGVGWFYRLLNPPYFGGVSVLLGAVFIVGVNMVVSVHHEVWGVGFMVGVLCGMLLSAMVQGSVRGVPVEDMV